MTEIKTVIGSTDGELVQSIIINLSMQIVWQQIFPQVLIKNNVEPCIGFNILTKWQKVFIPVVVTKLVKLG